MPDQEVDLKQISLEALEHFKKNDYLKLFKKPMTWKKKRGVIFIAKYKFDNGKLPVVAIPFKKFNDAQKAFKEKVKPNHASKYVLLGELEMYKKEDGNIVASVTPKMGGADIEMAAAKLFSKMKMLFELKGTQTEEQLQVKAKQPKLDPKKQARLKKKKENRLKRYQLISKNISKLEALFTEGDLAPEKIAKLIEGLNKYSDALSAMLEEVYEDEVVDQEEETMINELDMKVQEILEQLEDQNFMTEEHTEAAYLAEIKAKFVTYVKEFRAAFKEAQDLIKDNTLA